MNKGDKGKDLYGSSQSELSDETVCSDCADTTYNLYLKNQAKSLGDNDYYYSDNSQNNAEYASATVTENASKADFLVEDFAPVNNAKSVSHLTRIPEKAVMYCTAALYIILGAVCAVFSNKIEGVLPYVVGIALCVFSVVRFTLAISDKEYKSTSSNKTVSSLILLGLAIMILIEREWAHTFIPIAWGVWGLVEGAEAFNHALSRIIRHKNCVYYIIKGITEVVIAFLLIYKPERYGELHILIFGISLMLDGIVLLPFVHRFVTKK